MSEGTDALNKFVIIMALALATLALALVLCYLAIQSRPVEADLKFAFVTAFTGLLGLLGHTGTQKNSAAGPSGDVVTLNQPSVNVEPKDTAKDPETEH